MNIILIEENGPLLAIVPEKLTDVANAALRAGGIAVLIKRRAFCEDSIFEFDEDVDTGAARLLLAGL